MASGRVFEAVTIDNTPQEDDVEAAYQNWRSGLEDSETPGMVRAFRVPLDEQGKPSYSASGQVRLGTWPIDQYDFDGLCTKIMREYMLPTESMMAVRLIGTITGKGGLRFNKIVTLQRPNNTQALLSGPKQDGIADIMRQMQESNQSMLRMFQEMGGQKNQGDGGSEMMRTVAMMRVMMEPMMGMMGPILTAVAGRPVGTPGPSSSMKETIETMMLMDKFMGRRGSGSESSEGGPDWLKMVTAVSGVAKPLLEMAANNQTQATRTRQNIPRITPPTPPITAQPGRVVTASTPQVTTPPAATGGVDLSQPSASIQSPFAPGPNIEAPSSSLMGDPAMFAEMKANVDALVELAKTNADPVAVANQFFELTMLNIPNEENYGKLCAVIENDNFLSVIGALNTHVSQHEAWFTRMRARLMERITEADTPTAH